MMTKTGWMMGLAGLALLLTTGCGESQTQTTTTTTDRYTVRGEVTGLSLDDEPAMVSVHHEAVPDFRDVTGEVVGMDAMTMSFTLESADLAADLATGDKVRMVFEMRPDQEYPLVATQLEELPADTELDFGSAAAPTDGHGDHDHDHAGHDHDHAGHAH